jgi:type VI secretion system protein ImpG
MDEATEFLARFHEELAYLRSAGQSFAARHPKIAERLQLDREGSADPHVERLIESFAFLTARLQRRFDADFPEFTEALLGLLYPSLVHPIPPMTVACIAADPARGKLTSGYTIARRTQLFAQTADGLTCRFQTAYPVTLWPLEVVSASFVARNSFDFLDARPEILSVLRLQLESRGATFADLELQQLRFHLNGPANVTGHLYDLIFRHCTGIALYDRVTGKSVFLPASSLRPVGFGDNASDHVGDTEEVIPSAPESHPAYRLLQEYFWLPEKFLFFDLLGLDRNPSTQDLDILLLLDAPAPRRLLLTPDTFALGCTPIVNLFPRTSEPIRVDETRAEYRLVPDARRERTTEVHSILAVSSSSNPAEASRTLRPIYGAAGSTLPGDAFWYARRSMTERAEASGTDLHIAFVDLAFNPSRPPMETAFAHLLCTNRDLATQLTENSLLQSEEPGPIASIRCLYRPTPPGYPPLGGASRWALLSNLRLNSLSLTDGPNALDALRKILELYSLSGSAAIQRQIAGIASLSVRKVMRHRPSGLAREAHWQSLRRGYRVTLGFAPNTFANGGTHLFAAVLERFFQLYVETNSFVEVTVAPPDDRRSIPL